MVNNQKNDIGYDQWMELTSKDMFFYEDEKPKSLSRLYDMFGDDFEDEELFNSKSKVQKR